MILSLNVLNNLLKKYDGMSKGSSSLWGPRIIKGYGIPLQTDNNMDFYKNGDNFNFRCGFYERILKPEEMFNALKYCPLVLDIEIFDSIYSDSEGVITMPDEENRKEYFSHSVNVLGFNDDRSNFVIDSHWRDWGNGGMGLVSLDYLHKYFITAFAQDICINEVKKKKNIYKKNIVLNGAEWTYLIFQESSFRGDNRLMFNIEIFDKKNNIVGWVHFAKNSNKIIEVLDLFILKNYRRKGLGSLLIDIIKNSFNNFKIIGYISSHDLIEEREDIIKSFLLKNNFLVYVDKSHFHDCRFRMEPISCIA